MDRTLLPYTASQRRTKVRAKKEESPRKSGAGGPVAKKERPREHGSGLAKHGRKKRLPKGALADRVPNRPRRGRYPRIDVKSTHFSRLSLQLYDCNEPATRDTRALQTQTLSRYGLFSSNKHSSPASILINIVFYRYTTRSQTVSKLTGHTTVVVPT